MKLLNTQFVQGVVEETAILYNGIPHIAFIGRSNVGKSSTLNALVGQKKLVKVGQTPGKTREINFFKSRVVGKEANTEGELYLVDLPGYGYAKLSKSRRNELKNLIEWYLTHPQADTALVCLIIDSKVGITGLDREIIETLKSSKKSFIIAANKIDKLNQKAQHKLTQDLKEEFGDDIKCVMYSAVKSKRVNVLLDTLLAIVFKK